MSPTDDAREMAVNIVLRQLPPEGVTRELIDEIAARTVEFVASWNQEARLDVTAVSREVEARTNVWVADATVLEGNDDHQPWLEARRPDVDWQFWPRYRTYLENKKRYTATMTRSLDDITDTILGLLEDPARTGRWDRRGLVNGQVQSGKTANYTALIAKAVDAGYRLVIVLAGLDNSLRSQTQLRLDEGILGFDTRRALRFDTTNKRFGVGKEHWPQQLIAHSLTSSQQSGDFAKRVADNMGITVGGQDPIVLVVKKNKSILTNVKSWATGIRKEVDPSTGKHVVRNVPLLVIDDEADNASVDTRRPPRGADPEEYEPSVINGLIRELLNGFEQSCYVGYTATPFANILSSDEATTAAHGDDIFPRSFIVNLPAPTSYVGPARFFGVQADIGMNVDAVRPLPLWRAADDYDSWLPDRHPNHSEPGELADSVRTALKSFLIAGAVRRARGAGNEHHSMLVHVTRFTSVQRAVAKQIDEEWSAMTRRLVHGDGARTPTLVDELEEQWRSDFVTTTDRLLHEHGDVLDQVGPEVGWESIQAELAPAAQKTTVRTINGSSDEALAYADTPEGLSVIAVGGNKLSRGLTLEGLTTSYYLRTSNAYDTLMQMGRWFGYRPGYLDACRLYTPDQLSRRFVAVTAASEELVREFDAMARVNKTPAEFGLRVRHHPDGLLVTAPSKMRHARKLTISFSGDISETINFRTDSAAREANMDALRRLVAEAASLGTASPGTGSTGTTGTTGTTTDGRMLYRDVPTEVVTTFLSAYVGSPASHKAVPSVIRDYVEARTHDSPPELTRWTVLVASGSSRTFELGEGSTPLVHRARYDGTGNRPAQPAGERLAETYTIRRLVSPSDEKADLLHDESALARALERTIDEARLSTRRKTTAPPTTPSGRSLRHERAPSDGLLIIYPLDPAAAAESLQGEDPFVGFAISFPESENAEPVEYQVNQVFWRNELWGDAEADAQDEEEQE